MYKVQKQIQLLSCQKGFILMTAYITISALLIIALSIFSRSMVYRSAAERHQNRVVAFNMAEAGVDVAISQLMIQDSSQADAFSRYPCSNYDADNDGTNEGCSTNYQTLASQAGNILGGYQVWVNDPVGGDSVYRQIRVSGHTPVDGNSTTAGQCVGASSTQIGYECRAIETYVELDSSLFQYAVFSEGDLVFNGASTFVDSYDSSLGSYGGSNIQNNGDVGSNGTLADGDITLNGSPTINGEIEENLGIYCNAVQVTPPIATMGSLRVNNVYTLPSVANNVYRYDSIRVQSNNGVLHIGPTDPADPNYGVPITIYVDGDLTVSAGEIQAHSPVEFYVAGEVSLGGNGAATSNNLPDNFIIYATSSAAVSISGGAEFYGAIYAPDSEVAVNGGVDFYGGIFGTDFDGNGAGSIHYDEQLQNMKLPCSVVRFRSWREINTIALGS